MTIACLGLFFLYCAWEEGKVKVTPNRIHYVMAINVTVLAATGALVRLFSSQPVDMAGVKEILDQPTWRIALAGFEDAVFVLPVFMLSERSRPFFLTFLAIAFASAHSYQGFGPAAAKVFFVPVVYLMAKRWGILTTMIAHSVQDLLAISLLRHVLSQ